MTIDEEIALLKQEVRDIEIATLQEEERLWDEQQLALAEQPIEDPRSFMSKVSDGTSDFITGAQYGGMQLPSGIEQTYHAIRQDVPALQQLHSEVGERKSAYQEAKDRSSFATTLGKNMGEMSAFMLGPTRFVSGALTAAGIGSQLYTDNDNLINEEGELNTSGLIANRAADGTLSAGGHLFGNTVSALGSTIRPLARGLQEFSEDVAPKFISGNARQAPRNAVNDVLEKYGLPTSIRNNPEFRNANQVVTPDNIMDIIKADTRGADAAMKDLGLSPRGLGKMKDNIKTTLEDKVMGDRSKDLLDTRRLQKPPTRKDVENEAIEQLRVYATLKDKSAKEGMSRDAAEYFDIAMKAKPNSDKQTRALRNMINSEDVVSSVVNPTITQKALQNANQLLHGQTTSSAQRSAGPLDLIPFANTLRDKVVDIAQPNSRSQIIKGLPSGITTTLPGDVLGKILERSLPAYGASKSDPKEIINYIEKRFDEQ